MTRVNSLPSKHSFWRFLKFIIKQASILSMLTIFIQYTLVLVLRGRVVIFEPNIVIAFAEFCMVVGTTFFVIIETLERVTEWIRGDVK